MAIPVNQTINETMNQTGNLSAVPFMGNLSWQATIIFITLIICFAAIIIIALFKKGPVKKHSKSPFFKAAILTLGFSIVIIIAEGFGALPEGTIKDYGMYIFLGLFLGIYLSLLYNENVDGEKQSQKYEQIAWKHVKRKYHAMPNKGDGYGHGIMGHVVLPNESLGTKDTDVCFLLLNTDEGINPVVAIGVQSSSILQCEPYPNPDFIEKVFGKYIRRNFMEQSRMNPMQYEKLNAEEVNNAPTPA